MSAGNMILSCYGRGVIHRRQTDQYLEDTCFHYISEAPYALHPSSLVILGKSPVRILCSASACDTLSPR